MVLDAVYGKLLTRENERARRSSASGRPQQEPRTEGCTNRKACINRVALQMGWISVKEKNGRGKHRDW